MRWWSFLWLSVCATITLCAQVRRTDARAERMLALYKAADGDSLHHFAENLLATLPQVPSDIRQQAEYFEALALQLKEDPVGAMVHAQQAVLISRALKDTSRMLGAMYLIMKLNIEGHHYDEADRNRKDNYALARAYGKDTLELGRALNAMGSMYSRMQRSDSAEHYYREGLKLAGNGWLPLRVALMNNLASTLSLSGRYEESMRLHQQVLKEQDTTELRARAWTYSSLGESLLLMGRYREAIAAFDKGEALNQRSGSALDLAIDLGELRAQCLDSLGDIAGALKWTKHVRDLQDTLFERSMSEQLVELEKKFETRLNRDEIARLDEENARKADLLRAKNVQLYGSLALVALALGGVALVWRNLRQKRMHAATLEKLNAELKGQKERIEEINRLLQLKVLRTQINPHFIYNCLHAIGNLVSKGDRSGAFSYLDGFARMLRMVLDHSVKDRVPLSQEMDFLRQYTELESLRFGGDLHVSVEADAVLLDEDVPVPALLVQPFVENAIWHGLATRSGEKHLSVRFTERDQRIICIVEDNGVGRVASPKRSHPDGSASMGLQLTNERLQLLTYQLQGTDRVTFTDLERDGVPCGTRVEVVLA